MQSSMQMYGYSANSTSCPQPTGPAPAAAGAKCNSSEAAWTIDPSPMRPLRQQHLLHPTAAGSKQQEGSPEPRTPAATSSKAALKSGSPLSPPSTPRHQSQQAVDLAAAAVGSSAAATAQDDEASDDGDAGNCLIKSLLAYLPDSDDEDDEDGILAAAAAAAAGAGATASGDSSQSGLTGTPARTTVTPADAEHARYLVATVAKELKLQLPSIPTSTPDTTAAGFTSSASSRLATAAASSLLVAQSSSSKKVNIFGKQTAAYSSTGQPAAVQLMTHAPQTPAEAVAAVRAAVAASAAAMGFSIDEEVAKLRVTPPANAAMGWLADVDPSSHPTAWQFLRALNNEKVLASGDYSPKNVMAVVNEVVTTLEGSPPEYTIKEVTVQPQGSATSLGTPAAHANPAAAAAASMPATAASTHSSSKAGIAFEATIRITSHRQVVITATGIGPNQREAKRAASAAALEQILLIIPGLVLRKFICQLNLRVSDMLQQRRQPHLEQDIDDMVRCVSLLDPHSAAGREQRQRLQKEQENQRKKAEAVKTKRQTRLAHAKVGGLSSHLFDRTIIPSYALSTWQVNAHASSSSSPAGMRQPNPAVCTDSEPPTTVRHCCCPSLIPCGRHTHRPSRLPVMMLRVCWPLTHTPSARHT